MIWNESQSGMPEGSKWWLHREAAIELAAMMDDGCSKRPSSEAAQAAGELLLGENGKPEKSRGNLRAALQKLGVELWYDELAERHMVAGLRGHGPKLQDAGMRALDDLLDEQYGLAFNWKTLVRYLLTVAEMNKRHPVREYLAGLKWDGVQRLDAWLSTYLGAEETPYTREVGRLVLLAAVARVRQPGCKFDEMMILEGAQAPLFVKVLRLLVGNDEWFTDKAAIAGSARSFTKSIIGKWIAVDTDLREMRRGDARSLHILLSSSTDRIRVRRHQCDYPRQCIFIGTTSEKRYLKEANRRFWPVEARKIAATRLMNDRKQLWAEAAERQSAGESIRMDESLWATAAIEQEKRRLPE